MSTARTTILDSIQAALVTGAASSTRVYRGRYNELAGTSFPATYLYPVREEVETLTMGTPTPPRFQLRKLTLAVEFWATAATPELLEEALDTAGSTIENSVLLVATTSALRDLVLTSYEWSYEAKEDRPFGCVRLTFTITFSTTK
jgi:hypothetical protein